MKATFHAGSPRRNLPQAFRKAPVPGAPVRMPTQYADFGSFASKTARLIPPMWHGHYTVPCVAAAPDDKIN